MSPQRIFLVLLIAGSSLVGFSQVGIGTTTPDNSAALHIDASTKGLLIPRLTTSERNNLVDPADGLLVFDSDLEIFYFWNEPENAWYSLNPWSNQGTEEDGTEYDITALLSTNVGIGVEIPQEKLHVALNARIDSNLFVGKDVSITGDITVDAVTAATISGNGPYITNVNAELLDGRNSTYFGTATDVTNLETNKADRTEVFTPSNAVTVSSTTYCWSTNTVKPASNVSYTQIGNLIFVQGIIYFTVASEYYTICAQLSGLPDFPADYGRDATGADLKYYQDSKYNHYGGSMQIYFSDRGYGNIIQFHRVENRNFATGSWAASFQFFYRVP